MILWLIIAFSGLTGIAFQDFKSRAVYWWWFPVTFLGLIGILKSFYGTFLFVEDSIMNLGITMVVASLTALGYMVRKGLSGLITLRGSIGLGDLVMVPMLMYCFSPLNYLVFFISSLVVAIIGYLIWTSKSRTIDTIPLAGCWSVMLFIALTLTITGLIDIRNDNWIYLWLMN